MTKKALYITDSLHNGGAERQLALLASNLPSDWECQVWSLSDGPYSTVLKESSIAFHVSQRRNKKDISPMFDLWKLIKAWKPDIVHSWNWMSSAAALPICKLLKIPLIDGSIRMGRKPIFRMRTQGLVMKFADLLIANSIAGLHAWDIDSKRGRVVYNGFDMQRFQAIQPLLSIDKHFRVIMTGRMSKEKDFNSFIQVAEQLSKDGHDWHFIALGDGPDRFELLTKAKDLIEKGIIEFPEPGIEVLNWVRGSDVGLLLTNSDVHAEGCSNSIMEYMACGLPVICTEGGGNSELVVEDETGFIIPTRDTKRIAEILKMLRSDVTLRVKMGNAGQVRIENQFSVRNLINNTIQVYQELIK